MGAGHSCGHRMRTICRHKARFWLRCVLPSFPFVFISFFLGMALLDSGEAWSPLYVCVVRLGPSAAILLIVNGYCRLLESADQDVPRNLARLRLCVNCLAGPLVFSIIIFLAFS